MIDFNKKIVNSDKFRQAALFFEKNGCYTFAPEGTTDYFNYWKQEQQRCLNGYTAPDGDQITGYHYFYLNYSPIMKLVETEYTDRNGTKRTRRERLFRFPDFWDYDWFYYNAIEQAEDEGKHMVVLKARARGYSFKGASMLCRNYFLIPKSKNFAVASEQKFLTGDGLLTKAWQIMDFLDKHSGWAKRRLRATSLERTSGFKVKDEITGKEVEDGYLSSVTGITLKNDPERIRGTRGRLFLWEESGKFPDIKQAWQIARPSVETDDGVAFGLMIAFGTGGSEGCLPGNAIVITDDGYRRIDNVQTGSSIYGYDIVEQDCVKQTVSHIVKKQLPCVKIQTNQYRDIECSTNHLLYASNRYDCNKCRVWEWLCAEDLKPGDLVAISPQPNVEKESIRDPYLIGLLVGDGSYITSPRITNCDEEVHNYLLKNYECKDYTKPYFTKDGRVVRTLGIKHLRTELRELDIYGQSGKNKRIPQRIFNCSKEQIGQFLSGLIDTDGNVNIHTCGKGKRLPVTDISIAMVGLDLAKDVRDLLSLLNVHGCIQYHKERMRDRKINSKLGYYSVDVVDRDSVINLSKWLRLKIAYKQSLLEQSVAICNKKTRWHRNDFWYEKIVDINQTGIKQVYDIQCDSFHTYISNGFINHNCNFEGLSDMFYHPEGFNCLDFDNIWDEGMTDKKCGFFVPAWSNLQSDEHPECMDSDGNTNRSASVQVILEQRRIVRDSQPDETVTDRYIAEHPNTPQEAILEVGKNIFPKKQLQIQLNKLRTNTKLANMKHVVDLVWEGDGTVKAIEKKGGDITHYPLKKGEQPTGSVVIYEYPVKDPPYGLYIAGQDPYDQDGSLTNSLGSTFIYKRFQPGEAWSDVIVAEYSGRPDTAEEYYENVRKLLTMYNAKLLFENERKGIYPYFTNKHCDYMLADQPDKVISEIFKDSKVQRKKGCHMTKQIRSYAEGLIKEWLLEEYEPGHPNLERIYSEPLIEELLLDDGVRNVDRVIALCMVMLYREELYQVKIAAAKEQNKQIDFFETPLFSNQWFDEDSSYDDQYDNNIPTFTF